MFFVTKIRISAIDIWFVGSNHYFPTLAEAKIPIYNNCQTFRHLVIPTYFELLLQSQSFSA